MIGTFSQRWFRTVAVVLAGSLAVLTGCGGSAPAASAPAASGPAASAPAASGSAASGTPAAGSRPAAAPSAGQASGKPIPLHIVYGGGVILMIPLWAAVDGGFFKNFGFAPQPPVLMGGYQAVSALVSGQVDVAAAGAFATAAAVASGAKVRMIAVANGQEPFIIYANKKIGSPQALRGGRVATAGAGSESQIAFQLYLKKVGLPLNSVTYVNAGNANEEVAAIAGGAVTAGAFIPPLPSQVTAKLRPLDNLMKRNIPWITNGFIISQSMIAQHPGRAQRILEALEEGARYAAANPAFTEGLIGKYMKISQPSLQKQGYEAYKALLPKGLAPPTPALDAVIAQVMAARKATTRQVAASFFDGSLLQKLQANGFLAAHGAP